MRITKEPLPLIIPTGWHDKRRMDRGDIVFILGCLVFAALCAVGLEVFDGGWR